MALMVMLTLGFTSCKQDTQPRLEQPTEFHLNTPQLANNTYVLTEGDQFILTCSQPNYGLGLPTTYEVQVSLTEDFAKFEALPAPDTQAKVVVKDEDLALAICTLMGAVDTDTEDLYDPSVRTIYMRLRAYIPNADYSSICSNVVPLRVKPYFAVKLPARLWVIGDVSGWNINASPYVVSEEENGIGSEIYTGVVNFTAEQAANGFRFYKELGDWGKDDEFPSIGANGVDGDNASVSIDAEGSYTGACVPGKGNWNITNWPGGNMKITVNLKEMKVTFQKVD